MTNKKALVITAVGAGGKSTYLHERALEFVRTGKTAAITTTTHIWRPEKKDCAAIEAFDSIYESGSGLHTDDKAGVALVFHGTDGIDTIGVPMDDGRLSAPSYEDYRRICSEYDAVLAEGDGSRCMPVKIPGPGEPVIPEGADEIAVVMGTQAVGRRLDTVCHRYDRERLEKAGIMSGDAAERADNKITVSMLERIAEEFYVKPLHDKYPDAKVFYVPSPYQKNIQSDMTQEFAGVTAVLLASGFGRRYGGNKLLDTFHDKPLYRHALDHITEALGNDSVLVVTQYDEIISQAEEAGITVIKNNDAAEGISASIRIGTRCVLDSFKNSSKRAVSAVVFFAADMPYLSSEEIRKYVMQFLWSGKTFGCMEYGPEHIMTNPGAFRLNRVPSPLAAGGQIIRETAGKKKDKVRSGETKEEIENIPAVSDMLLSMTGDSGAMRIMKKYPHEIYRYQVPAGEVADIDVRQPAAV